MYIAKSVLIILIFGLIIGFFVYQHNKEKQFNIQQENGRKQKELDILYEKAYSILESKLDNYKIKHKGIRKEQLIKDILNYYENDIREIDLNKLENLTKKEIKTILNKQYKQGE